MKEMQPPYVTFEVVDQYSWSVYRGYERIGLLHKHNGDWQVIFTTGGMRYLVQSMLTFEAIVQQRNRVSGHSPTDLSESLRNSQNARVDFQPTNRNNTDIIIYNEKPIGLLGWQANDWWVSLEVNPQQSDVVIPMELIDRCVLYQHQCHVDLVRAKK